MTQLDLSVYGCVIPSVYECVIPSVYECVVFCINVIQADKSFLQSLFKGLSTDNADDNSSECVDGHNADDESKLRRRRDMAKFLKEFCLFSQALALENRDEFFKVSIHTFYLSQTLPTSRSCSSCITNQSMIEFIFAYNFCALIQENLETDCGKRL